MRRLFSWRTAVFALGGFIAGAVFLGVQLFQSYGTALDHRAAGLQMLGAGAAWALLGAILGAHAAPRETAKSESSEQRDA